MVEGGSERCTHHVESVEQDVFTPFRAFRADLPPSIPYRVKYASIIYKKESARCTLLLLQSVESVEVNVLIPDMSECSV